jgi:hypothetical protein
VPISTRADPSLHEGQERMDNQQYDDQYQARDNSEKYGASATRTTSDSAGHGASRFDLAKICPLAIGRPRRRARHRASCPLPSRLTRTRPHEGNVSAWRRANTSRLGHRGGVTVSDQVDAAIEQELRREGWSRVARYGFERVRPRDGELVEVLTYGLLDDSDGIYRIEPHVGVRHVSADELVRSWTPWSQSELRRTIGNRLANIIGEPSRQFVFSSAAPKDVGAFTRLLVKQSNRYLKSVRTTAALRKAATDPDLRKQFLPFGPVLFVAAITILDGDLDQAQRVIDTALAKQSSAQLTDALKAAAVEVAARR